MDAGDKKKLMTLKAGSVEDKRKWVSDIRKVIVYLQEKQYSIDEVEEERLITGPEVRCLFARLLW
jgi:hypothetical protein